MQKGFDKTEKTLLIKAFLHLHTLTDPSEPAPKKPGISHRMAI